ncbi:MAG TPA: iron-sulfur cluster assembly protein [Steroidobacter sp.]|nr:iron-sulfur cluster assembly protein [Steroidobacter sp.]
MFIQTEATPDPAQLKFLPDCDVLVEGALDLRDKTEAAARSPLAERLFAIPGVAGVSLHGKSIIVTKDRGEWRHLESAVREAIINHFLSGAPVLRESSSSPQPTEESPDRFRDALRQVIDPELGYNIVDLGLIYDVTADEHGKVRITMTTTTPGCPATNYLKQGAGESVSALPGVEFVEVTLTHEPRWTPEMMSPEAKAYFGIRDEGKW